MTSQPTLIRLLATKNSAIADVICWLAQNVNADGIVENCTLTEVTACSGKSKDAVISAFRVLEITTVGRRTQHRRDGKTGKSTMFQFRQQFLSLFETTELSHALIDFYIILSDQINETTASISKRNYTYKLRKEN